MEICPICYTFFEKKASNQIYCCKKCKRSTIYDCSYCDNQFIAYKSKSKNHFCSLTCAALFSGRSKKVNCQNCSNTFVSPVSELEMGYGKYCSKKCANEGNKMNFEKECPCCGNVFITRKNKVEQRKYCSKECMKKSFRKPIDKGLLVRLYIHEKRTTREIGQIINRSKKVVLDYLNYYEIPIRPDGFKNKERIICKDGDKVRSNYERVFDDLLYENDIEHVYDPRLPFNKRLMADFKVKDVYVEIWGMMSIPSYEEKRNRKIQLYKKHKCKLLEIFPEDFNNINNKILELKHLIK